MRSLGEILRESSLNHQRLCPRQILGVRVGLAGLKALGFNRPPVKKQLLAITETDGCFVDGVIAATSCTIGHRTLRVEDYGKVASTFVNTKTGYGVRVAPALDIRRKALRYTPDETRHYFAQMQAYQIMPDEELLTIQKVLLGTPIEQIISKPNVRVNCDVCGEEIMNGREIRQCGYNLCVPCADDGYYQLIQGDNVRMRQIVSQ